MNKFKAQLDDFERYKRLLAYLLKRDSSYDDFTIDDLLQDLYIKYHSILVRNAVEFEDYNHLKTILTNMTYRLIRGKERNRNKYYGHGINYSSNQYAGKRLARAVTATLDKLSDIYHPKTLNSIEQKETLNQVYTIIDSNASKNDSKAFRLHIAGYTPLEISRKLNRTERAVIASNCRVRKILKMKL